MKNILVAIDQSECSTRAIEQARDLATLYGAKLTILHVYDNKYFDIFIEGSYNRMDVITQMKADLEKQSHLLLSDGKALCAELGDQVETLSLEGNPANKIIDYVDAHDIDLLVMGSHGMSGFRRFFLGSVTHKVAVSIEKPILIIR